jgi:Zn-dependent protease
MECYVDDMFPRLRSFRIGKLLGFPIDVNASFLIVLGIVLLFWGGLSGVFAVLVAFASVLLHELGHAVTARRLGVPVAGIELHFFGGTAKMVGQPKTANDEVLIAAAGPAVSFVLGALGLILGVGTGALGLHAAAMLFEYIGWINLIIGVFNLVPALPMDGGRILRALLTRKVPFERATEISVRIARGFAIALGLTGLFTLQLYLILLAAFLWILGASELRLARLIGHQFTYDRSGYRRYDHAGVEVLPSEYADILYQEDQDEYGRGRFGGVQSFGWPGFGARRPGQGPGGLSFGGYVIRRRNGRLVIEFIG